MRHEITESQSEPPKPFRSLDGRSLDPRLGGLVSFPHYPFMVIMIGDHCSVFILFCMHTHSVSYLTFSRAAYEFFLDHCDLDCSSATFLSSSLPSITRSVFSLFAPKMSSVMDHATAYHGWHDGPDFRSVFAELHIRWEKTKGGPAGCRKMSNHNSSDMPCKLSSLLFGFRDLDLIFVIFASRDLGLSTWSFPTLIHPV